MLSLRDLAEWSRALVWLRADQTGNLYLDRVVCL